MTDEMVKTHAVIPVKSLANIKSRLSPVLNLDLRRRFSLHMLSDVVNSAKRAGLIGEILVVSPDPEVLRFSSDLGVKTLHERSESGVNRAVSAAADLCVRRGASAMLVLPSDIPLVSPQDLNNIINMGLKLPSVVVSPSVRLDGTNALLLKPPKLIPTRYEQNSFRSHLRLAASSGVRVAVYMSRNVMLDVDSPEDLKNLLSVRSDASSWRFLNRSLTRKPRVTVRSCIVEGTIDKS